MGKLGKSIQAGLWLWYWKLLTTTNSSKLPPASCCRLFGSFLAPPRHSHSVVYVERQCPLCQPCFYSSCPLGWFRHCIFIETPWLYGQGWIPLKGPLGSVVPSTCWSTIVILLLYFLWDGVGRRAQKWSKGWQGSVNSKDVTNITSYSVNLSL